MKYEFLKRDTFNFWTLKVITPRLKWGKVTYSEDYDASLDDAKKFSLDFDTSAGYYNSTCMKSVWLIFLGFGFSLSHQNGY